MGRDRIYSRKGPMEILTSMVSSRGKIKSSCPVPSKYEPPVSRPVPWSRVTPWKILITESCSTAEMTTLEYNRPVGLTRFKPEVLTESNHACTVEYLLVLFHLVRRKSKVLSRVPDPLQVEPVIFSYHREQRKASGKRVQRTYFTRPTVT